MHFKFHFHYDIASGFMTMLLLILFFAFTGKYDVSSTLLIITFVLLVVWAFFMLLRGRI